MKYITTIKPTRDIMIERQLPNRPKIKFNIVIPHLFRKTGKVYDLVIKH